MDRIVPAILIPLFGMNAYQLNYLKQIECSCALNYTHFFLLCLSIFLTSIASISFIFGSEFIISALAKYQVLTSVKYLFSPVLLIILFISFTSSLVLYKKRLKKNNCECLNSVYKDMMYGVRLVEALVFSILGIFLILFILSKNI